jgi:hypothetical protein
MRGQVEQGIGIVLILIGLLDIFLTVLYAGIGPGIILREKDGCIKVVLKP